MCITPHTGPSSGPVVEFLQSGCYIAVTGPVTDLGRWHAVVPAALGRRSGDGQYDLGRPRTCWAMKLRVISWLTGAKRWMRASRQ